MGMKINMILPGKNSNETDPDSLYEQCIKYIISNMDILVEFNPYDNHYHLRQNLTLPTNICDRLFQAYQQAGNDADDEFVRIFENPETSRLRRVKLKSSSISNQGLCMLLKHKLIELDLSCCSHLTTEVLGVISDNADRLKSLCVGPYVEVIPETLNHFYAPTTIDGRNFYESIGYVINAPNLRKLLLHGQHFQSPRQFFNVFLRPMRRLTHLDLSHCYNLDDLSYLTELPCLFSLTLYNVKSLFPNTLETLTKLKTLRHLDVSQLSPRSGTYDRPNEILSTLVENLPNLKSLDISGTNLAGSGVAEFITHDSNEIAPVTDIPGLKSRVGNPFDFLGLYKTHHDACKRHDIPAKCISGDDNEDQLFNAMIAYMDRPDILQKVIINLFHIFQYEDCNNVSLALKLVLESMDRHLQDKEIQICGSASLYYLAQIKTKNPPFEMKLKHHMISSIINGMLAYKNDETMMRNGCFTLCQFNIPEDVMFDYDRLAHIVLMILADVDQDIGLLQRTAIYLLNSLACQAEQSQKLFLGELGAVSTMLTVVRCRLTNRLLDDVLQVAWSAMWNVTDETAINCKRFLDGNGMELFLRCLAVCSERDELLRSMMGLLGNVSEVKSLRPRLMRERYVTVFANLLQSMAEGIEVSYNACGVLAHMCSDGPEAWMVVRPKREAVLKKMVAAIEMWDLSVERIINYRSFQPILNLLKVWHTPECQHWAVWALANLTRVYPTKYCRLVVEDDGIPMLEDILNSKTCYRKIKILAEMVLNNCNNYYVKIDNGQDENM